MATLRAVSVAAAALAATLTISLSAAVANDTATEDTQATTTPMQDSRVSLVSANGSGCPAGSVRVSTAGNDSINLIYSDYEAATGDGISATEARKNCALGLQVDAPDGWTFAVRGLRYVGFAHLENGASGLQRAEYYVQGTTDGTVVEHEFSGPYDGSVSRSDDIAYENLVWAPCDLPRNVNVNTELRVNGGSSGDVSVMAMAATSAPGTVMQLAWKRC